MTNRLRTACVVGAALVLMMVAGAASGQTRSGGSTWKAPRTVDGQPDLQGVWANNAVTPLERPRQLANKPVLTDAELADLKRRAANVLDGGDAQFGADLFEAALVAQERSKSYDPTTGNYNQAWMVERTWENRTSLIVDPPDGRVPPPTAQARARQDARRATRVNSAADSWEDRSLGERCITFGINKLIGAGYNSNIQIFQARDYVVVEMEMIHDVRIIPLDGRPHVPRAIGQWLGDSRGRWEGETLVVESTNFSPKFEFRGASRDLTVKERFTRVGPNTLKYEVTYEDPSTWTRPWTVVVNMARTSDHMYEYACHEGNHAMAGILAGARAQEKRAAEEAARQR